jgi:ParB family transcriptional regulator, chromosome partitioning protein
MKMPTVARPAAARSKLRRPKPKTGHEEFRQIPLDRISPHPNNPREDWDSQRINALVPSLRRFGLLQPIVVRQIESADGERYQIIAGERRFRAAQRAELGSIPCSVRNASDGIALAQMLTENLQRKNLSGLETAKLLARLCEPRETGGAGYTQKKAAKLFGKKQPWAAQLLAILKLPEPWLQKIQLGELGSSQARALARHADSPSFLETVERDIASSPWAWRTLADFERNLDLLLADPQIGQLSAAKPRAPRAAPSPRPVAAQAVERQQEPATTATGWAKPRGPSIDLGTLCAVISGLVDEELRQVEAAVAKRRAWLTARM